MRFEDFLLFSQDGGGDEEQGRAAVPGYGGGGEGEGGAGAQEQGSGGEGLRPEEPHSTNRGKDILFTTCLLVIFSKRQ